MMEGERHKKGNGKQPGKAEKGDKLATEGAIAKEHEDSNGG